MAHPRPFAPVKLICGVIYKEDALYDEVRRRLIAEWGRVDSESPPFAFDLTDYYEAEMGEGLSRRFMSFEALIAPEALPAHEAPGDRARGGDPAGARRRPGRPVNIDPGYLTRLGARHGHGQGFRPPRPARAGASTPTSSSCSPRRASRRSIGPIPICGGSRRRRISATVREIYLRQLRERGD